MVEKDAPIKSLEPLLVAAVNALLQHQNHKQTQLALQTPRSNTSPRDSSITGVDVSHASGEKLLTTVGVAGGSAVLDEQHPLRFIAQYLLRHKPSSSA